MALLFGCGQQNIPPEEAAGLPLELAVERASRISGVSYDLYFDIPDSIEEPVKGRAALRFSLSDASRPLILDFKAPTGSLVEFRAGDEPCPEAEHRSGQIRIPGACLRQGRNLLAMEFISTDTALNRNGDYLYTLFVPDRASTAFPSFDQPDLKAGFRLSLRFPAGWKALSNGREAGFAEQGEFQEIRFAPTTPISTYLFSFAAGKFSVVEEERRGRRMRMFHRESDSGRLEQSRKIIFDLHESALEWLEEYTQIEYPFEKFDFILIPSFQFGGMEHPGAIYYRDLSLLLGASATQSEELGRASLIAHETAHMWFGNLVTMKWFDDVWLKEVFANFMAARMVNPTFPELNHDLRFLMAHFPSAYEIDRSQGTHPIRQQLENLNDASSLYGAIIYQKAPIIMRHLEELLGRERFREGLLEYLKDYGGGNASWSDLIRILDPLTQVDLGEWSRQWVEGKGRPVIETAYGIDPNGKLERVVLRQSDPEGSGRTWVQKLQLKWVEGSEIRTIPLVLRDSELRVGEMEGWGLPDFILPAGEGIEYGLFLLDDRSLSYLRSHLNRVEDELTRGILWLTLWDLFLEARLEKPVLQDLLLETFEQEKNELILSRVIGDFEEYFWRFLNDEERLRAAPAFERVFWKRIEGEGPTSLKSALFETLQTIALSSDSLARLEELWRNKAEIEGLSLEEEDLTELTLELCLRWSERSGELLDFQSTRIQDAERRARLDFLRPALSADLETRMEFFDSLRHNESRKRERWVLDGLYLITHPLLRGNSVEYLSGGLDLLEEVKASGTIFFPKRWLDSLLWSHGTSEAAGVIRGFLAKGGLSPRLKDKVLQSSDKVFRAAQMTGQE